MDIFFAILILMTVQSQSAMAGYVAEGYLISRVADVANCLVQLNDRHEGTIMVPSNANITTAENANCELIVLETVENATLEQGAFYIQFKESGMYLAQEEHLHTSVSDEPHEFWVYNRTHETFDEPVGVAALLNSSHENDNVTVTTSSGLGQRCLQDYHYYATDGDDIYGYLKNYVSFNGPDYCRTAWWFVQVGDVYYLNDTTTEMETTMETTTENSASILISGTIQWVLLPLLLWNLQ